MIFEILIFSSIERVPGQPRPLYRKRKNKQTQNKTKKPPHVINDSSRNLRTKKLTTNVVNTSHGTSVSTGAFLTVTKGVKELKALTQIATMK